MNVFYFEFETQLSSTIVAIFAQNAENASVISGRLMHNIEQYEPQYSEAGLERFRQCGKPQQFVEALAASTAEGIAGYEAVRGWSVVPV